MISAGNDTHFWGIREVIFIHDIPMMFHHKIFPWWLPHYIPITCQWPLFHVISSPILGLPVNWLLILRQWKVRSSASKVSILCSHLGFQILIVWNILFWLVVSIIFYFPFHIWDVILPISSHWRTQSFFKNGEFAPPTCQLVSILYI